jgi:hypothetical protein
VGQSQIEIAQCYRCVSRMLVVMTPPLLTLRLGSLRRWREWDGPSMRMRRRRRLGSHLQRLG